MNIHRYRLAGCNHNTVVRNTFMHTTHTYFTLCTVTWALFSVFNSFSTGEVSFCILYALGVITQHTRTHTHSQWMLHTCAVTGVVLWMLKGQLLPAAWQLATQLHYIRIQAGCRVIGLYVRVCVYMTVHHEYDMCRGIFILVAEYFERQYLAKDNKNLYFLSFFLGFCITPLVVWFPGFLPWKKATPLAQLS